MTTTYVLKSEAIAGNLHEIKELLNGEIYTNLRTRMPDNNSLLKLRQKISKATQQIDDALISIKCLDKIELNFDTRCAR